eukprot:gb/GECG01015142.1/.p1 GENE.gb/GECG01015142.1/~~gb/GECG01015142.1/.p1  ORF type:complete len:100 (+),score=24.07 gb/GECG01015142.1/:1-300(+)
MARSKFLSTLLSLICSCLVSSLVKQANVMVEYNYDEAVELLERNQQVAQKKLKEIKEDLDFLRDNKITAEVNIARIFNYDVKLRKEQKQKEAAQQPKQS